MKSSKVKWDLYRNHLCNSKGKKAKARVLKGGIVKVLTGRRARVKIGLLIKVKKDCAVRVEESS